MEMQRYQQEVLRTVPSKITKKTKLTNFSLGLAGESGEVIDLLKKHIFHEHEIDIAALKAELGDLAWYMVNIANVCSIDMCEVMDMNIEKLKARYPNGFDKQRSKSR